MRFAKFALRVFLLKYFIQNSGLDFDFNTYIQEHLVISNLFRILLVTKTKSNGKNNPCSN